MKDTKNRTVYFDDYNIKAKYKATVAFKILSQKNAHAYESLTSYIIKMPIGELKKEDLNIEFRNKHIIVSPKVGPRALKIKKVFKLPNNIHVLQMNIEVKDETLKISIPKVDLRYNLN